MTVTAWFLIVLGVATLAGIVAFLLPMRRLNDPHPYVTDEAETEHEHEGRHRNSEDVPTTRLDDYRRGHPRA
jgi:hypothetical protein